LFRDGRAVAEYQYHFYDLSSSHYLDSLPCENVTFTQELRGVGTFTGDLPLYSSDELDSSRVLAATVPHRTKVFVERDSALVWGGRLIPPRDYDSTTGRITLNAEETLGIFDKRFLPTLSYMGIEQLDIARGLINTLQTGPGGNVGLQLGAGASGVKRDRNYALGDQTTGLSALTDLSEVIGGFEFSTQTVWSTGNTPQETLLFGYPRLGRVRGATGIVIEYNRIGSASGNVISYTLSDGEGLYTRCWAVTETDEGVQLVAHTDNTALLAAGYPLLEQSESFDGIVDLKTLQGHSDAMARYAAGHHATGAFVVAATPNLQLGDWQLGDDVLVRISDWRYPPDPRTGAPGFVDYMRIVGTEVSPGGQDTIEQYTFTMADFTEAL
jgi:hypothetical protein